jgi:hypothetical protein
MIKSSKSWCWSGRNMLSIEFFAGIDNSYKITIRNIRAILFKSMSKNFTIRLVLLVILPSNRDTVQALGRA